MTVPVIVGLTLNYRDAERTGRCVRSLLDDGVMHMLIWDNSEDAGNSARALEKLLGGENRVTIETSPINLGFAAGVNHGLTWIAMRFPGAWALLINNDAILLPGGLFALCQALSKTPTAVIAYPTIDHGGHLINTIYYQRHFGLITTTPLPGSIPYASGCCQLIALERISSSLFEEDFFMYGEDVELGHRLGMQCMVHVPAVWVQHEGSASSRLGSPFYEARMVAGHWLLARKLAKNRLDMGLLYVGRMIALTLRGCVRAWRYRSKVPLTGYIEGWRLAHPRIPRVHNEQ